MTHSSIVCKNFNKYSFTCWKWLLKWTKVQVDLVFEYFTCIFVHVSLYNNLLHERLVSDTTLCLTVYHVTILSHSVLNLRRSTVSQFALLLIRHNRWHSGIHVWHSGSHSDVLASSAKVLDKYAHICRKPRFFHDCILLEKWRFVALSEFFI